MYWRLWISVSLLDDVYCFCRKSQIAHTLQVNENLSWIVNCSTLARMLMRPAKQLYARTRVVGTQDHVLGTSTYKFWLYFAKFWVYLLEIFLPPIVHDKDVNWLSVVLISFLYNCHSWIVWSIVQHFYVLGLCHPALEQHRRMLGLVVKGLRTKMLNFGMLFGNTRSLCCFIVQLSL